MTTSNTHATLFWVIAVIALLWNIMGLASFIGQVTITEAAKALIPEDQLALMEATPSWMMVVFGIATIGGTLGSALLLMRKAFAKMLFLASALAVIIQMGYGWANADTIGVFGIVQGLIMPILIIVFAVFLYMYSKAQTAKGILR